MSKITTIKCKKNKKQMEVINTANKEITTKNSLSITSNLNSDFCNNNNSLKRNKNLILTTSNNNNLIPTSSNNSLIPTSSNNKSIKTSNTNLRKKKTMNSLKNNEKTDNFKNAQINIKNDSLFTKNQESQSLTKRVIINEEKNNKKIVYQIITTKTIKLSNK